MDVGLKGNIWTWNMSEVSIHLKGNRNYSHMKVNDASNEYLIKLPLDSALLMLMIIDVVFWGNHTWSPPLLQSQYVWS